nr:unnamed protein product [Callosobruchus analis]
MSQPKKRCTEESRDPEQWMRWFEELSCGDESPISESDEDEVDATEKSDHDTESELEVWDQETELDSSGEYIGTK